MKKRGLFLILILTMMFTISAAAANFTDVRADDYFADAVDWAVQNNITSGTSATTFSPHDTCTRAQIITLIWRAAGSPAPVEDILIRDIFAANYYCDAVRWARETSIFDDLYFYPTIDCTRQMAADFLWRAAGAPPADGQGFPDANDDAVKWAVAKGITSGTSNTTFSPDLTCSRAQIMTFLYRAFQADALNMPNLKPLVKNPVSETSGNIQIRGIPVQTLFGMTPEHILQTFGEPAYQYADSSMDYGLNGPNDLGFEFSSANTVTSCHAYAEYVTIDGKSLTQPFAAIVEILGEAYDNQGGAMYSWAAVWDYGDFKIKVEFPYIENEPAYTVSISKK